MAAKSYTVTSSTTIKAVTKPHVAGTVKITVTTAGGTATSASDYKFEAPVPTITSFTPTTGTTTGTTTVTITGTNLYGATAVKFGTTTAKSFTVTSPTTIKAVTKAHAPGTVNVKVTTAGGTATARLGLQVQGTRPHDHLVHPGHRDHLGHNDGDHHRHQLQRAGFTATAVNSAQQRPRASPSQAPPPSRP